MHRAPLSGFFVFALILAGCGSTSINLPPPPPHGGTAYTLPDGKGFVEVVRQDATDHPGQTQLVVHFLDAKQKSISSSVTNVSFAAKERKAAPIAFKPVTTADPARAGGLASAPFADPGEVAGLLSVTIDGKNVSVAVNLR
jgi:hypothetical protein